MVARLVRDPLDREGLLFELKWDGFRKIAESDHGGRSTYTAAKVFLPKAGTPKCYCP